MGISEPTVEGVALTAKEWHDRTVLVTGAYGLLGGHVAQRLHSAGARVVGLERDHVPQSRLAQEGTPIVRVMGDLCDSASVERILGEYECDTVLHLGAQAIVGVANRNPVSTFDSNIRGTWTLLEACRRSPLVKRIVVASSDKAYGDSAVLPYTEDMPLHGRHPYDVSKSCSDLIAQAYHATYGLPLAITRCGNLYGPGDLNFNRLVPGTLRSLIRGQRPVIRSDGSPVRDYIYVEDGADAVLILALALGRANARGQAFNFSDETPLSVRQMVELLRKRFGEKAPKPRILNKATHEIPKQYLSAAKARKTLRWKPRVGLKEGIDRTVAWYRTTLQVSP